MLTDTHCHLNFKSFNCDLGKVIENAINQSVELMVVPAITLQSCDEVVQLSELYESVYCAIGVHPNEANTWQTESYNNLLEIGRNPKVVAVGEIGLDYYRDYSKPDHQKKIFCSQLKLAGEINKPVIIHTRDKSPEDRSASDDIIQQLNVWINELSHSAHPLEDRPGVLHSFSGTIEHAMSAIELGLFIGITGPVTFKKADELRNIVRELPLDSILIETDAPFLTPVPYRGKRNEPSYVSFIAERIAKVKEIDPEEVASVTTKNARTLFGIQ